MGHFGKVSNYLYILDMSIDWKLLFHQLFALEIKKEFVLTADVADREDIYTRLLNAFVHYSPNSFNDVIDATMQAESAVHARQIREDFYEHPVSRALIRDLNFAGCVDAASREHAAIERFLAVIEANQERPIASAESFFASAEGENVAAAFADGGAGVEQQVALVMVPGYAAHTIEFSIFDEMVADANAFFGRPEQRPLLRADGIDLEFEDHQTFYERGPSERPRFDILHPAGTELGNTTGHNHETTDLIAEWIATLPAKYAATKFIFLGYSKGAPIVLDIVHRHPHLAARILGYVTHAGVMQGAHAARLFLSQAEEILRDVPMSEFVERLRAENPASLARVISPLFSQIDTSWLSLPRIRAVFEMLGYDTSDYERKADRLLGGREVSELLEGARDLAPLERVRWSLVHLGNENFSVPTYIFNLSAVADVGDFVRPVELDLGGTIGPSLMAPTFGEDGALDWEHLSIDALVLYFTSLAGFKNSPGGLFDTQVDLAGSKTLHLDRRALEASLTAEELGALWADGEVRAILQRNGVETPEQLAQTPRCELIKAEHRSNLDAVDLGEFRGHHWSLFQQALRPPPEVSRKHATWKFPRKAYMRALVQLLALRNLADLYTAEGVR